MQPQPSESQAASGPQAGARARSAQRVAIASSTGRTISIAGRELLFFGGCSYLALSHDPRVLGALNAAAARHGISSGASRETTGNVVEHEALERELAQALELEDALLLPEGATANLALGEALEGEFPLALVDSESHPTVLMAARLGSPRVERFAGAVGPIDQVRSADGEVAIWTDGVFPSSGRAAALNDLLAWLAPGHGCLIVDDCHGFGVRGARGRGSLEACAIHDPRVIVTGTLSKALGTYGGFVAGTRARIAAVRERSSLYSGTTPLAPPLTAAARGALSILVSDMDRLATYQGSVREFRNRLGAIGVPLKPLDFPVVAFELDPPERMRRVHEAALNEAIFLPLIHYAGGGRNGFFRIVWNAAHTRGDLELLVEVLRRALESA